jgi:hypothetical protein
MVVQKVKTKSFMGDFGSIDAILVHFKIQVSMH